MWSDIFKLLIGFVLTTIAGGFLGYWLQNRSWKRQNESKLLEQEKTTATKVFEDISKNMDKRLYRMRLLYWKLESETTRQGKLDEHMLKYREVLYEWNDNLNRNLALSQAYFGKFMRRELERKVYKAFREIGINLESCYRAHQNGGADQFSLQKIGTDVKELGVAVYNINLKIIRMIQDGNVGVFNPDTHNKEPRAIISKDPKKIIASQQSESDNREADVNKGLFL